MIHQDPNQLAIKVVRHASLSTTAREQIVTFCSRAFEEEMAPVFATFEQPTYVLGYWQGHLASHALWIERELYVDGTRPLRTAYVEAVATEASLRSRGFASAILQRLAAEIAAFDVGALSPSDEGFYARLGWEMWQGPLAARTADGLLPSPDDEEVMILRLPTTPALDVSLPLSIEWRAGDVW